jgi:hypothetical protein
MNPDLNQNFAVDRNMQVNVSSPKAFPLPNNLRRKLVKYLNQFDFISAAYLAQFTYVGNIDPRVGNRPCLTLALEINKPNCKELVTEVSQLAATALAGQLGEWRFLDFVPLTLGTKRAFQNAGSPIYVKDVSAV